MMDCVNGWLTKMCLRTLLQTLEVRSCGYCMIFYPLMAVENEMDGEALVTLLTTVQGPECLKDLIPKLGVRLKVYQRIKVVYNEEVTCLVSCMA